MGRIGSYGSSADGPLLGVRFLSADRLGWVETRQSGLECGMLIADIAPQALSLKPKERAITRGASGGRRPIRSGWRIRMGLHVAAVGDVATR